MAHRRKLTANWQRIVREADACTGPTPSTRCLRGKGRYSSHLSKWRLEGAVTPHKPHGH